MNRYFTIMIIPEKGEKGLKSIRIPRLLLNAGLFILLSLSALVVILGYDYWKILTQVYQNKHLTIENTQLKEQIQLFNMKINSLTNDINRIRTFEKKLRTISGFEQVNMTEPLQKQIKKESSSNISIDSLQTLEKYSSNEDYINLKNLYEQKIATNFGLQSAYAYTKDWNDLIKQSFDLAHLFAQFDYKFKIIKGELKT